LKVIPAGAQAGIDLDQQQAGLYSYRFRSQVRFDARLRAQANACTATPALVTGRGVDQPPDRTIKIEGNDV